MYHYIVPFRCLGSSFGVCGGGAVLSLQRSKASIGKKGLAREKLLRKA